MRRAVLLTALLASTSALAQDDPCEAPRSLMEAGLLDAAKEILETIDGSTTMSDCRGDVSEKLATAYKNRGNALRRVGAMEKAQEAYVTAITLQPQFAAELEGDLDPFAQVRELADLGELAGARAKLNELLAVQPSRAVPPDLHYLHGGGWSWWRSLRGEVFGLLPTIVEIILSLMVLVLAFLLLPRLVSAAYGLLRRKLVIAEFQSGGVTSPGGSGFAAAVQSQVVELARADQEHGIALVTAAAESVAIPDVVGQTSTLSQGVSAVLTQLIQHLPLAPFVVTGALHEPGRRGPGLTLHFLRGKNILATTTLWQSSFAPPGQADAEGERASYYLLGELAAVWILFQLKTHSRWPWQKPFQLLGTSDWKAFALFQAGVRAFEQADIERSAHCFQVAIVRDVRFYAARINLARTLYNTDRKAAKEQILAGLAVLTGEPASEAMRAKTDWKNVWERLEQAGGLDARAEETRSKERVVKLEAHLMDRWYYHARYSLLGLLAGELVAAWRTNALPSKQELRERIQVEADELSNDLLHAASMLFPRRRWSRRWVAEWKSELSTTIRDTAIALEPVVVALELLLDEDSHPQTEDPERLSLLHARAGKGSALLDYNLACLFSLDAEQRGQTAGEPVDTAVQCLVRAVKLEPNREGHISCDPLLVHLATTDAFKAYFGENEEKAPEGSVAQLELVGDEIGRALADRGIESVQALLLATVRRESRRRLALHLNVTTALALRWAYLAELCRIEGLHGTAINFLERAGVVSLESLASCNVKELAEKLADLNRVFGNELEIKDEELIAWVDDARKQLPTLVEGDQ